MGQWSSYLTKAIFLESGDQEGTLMVPCPPNNCNILIGWVISCINGRIIGDINQPLIIRGGITAGTGDYLRNL